MYITESAIKLEHLVNEICKSKGLDIKQLVEREDPKLRLVWKEAQQVFFKSKPVMN
ncbi:hypothetical protein [Paraclostridium sordellii]|uniref:hypothetical protein n=1 Tax=Paraclostridium sordellii TaxID=1505 RepID=UPI0015F73BAA|nr:hypothetical protein [Paeniclostridium sordellii]